MTDTNKTSGKSSGRNWLKIGFFVSVALNLAFVGMIAGASYKFRRLGGPETFGGHANPYVRALDHRDRRAIFEAVRSGDRRHPDPAVRQAQFDAVLALLRAEPFDAAAVQGLLREQSASVLGVQEAMRAQWLARISTMSEAERADYADRVQEALERRARWHKKRRRDRD